jgi:hypothetical protein
MWVYNLMLRNLLSWTDWWHIQPAGQKEPADIGQGFAGYPNFQ